MKELLYEIILDIDPDLSLQDLEELDHEAPMRDQLGFDSMDFLEMIVNLKREFKIDIPAEDFPLLKTMNGTLEYLESKMD